MRHLSASGALALLSASDLEERATLPIVGKTSGGESYNLRCTNQYGISKEEWNVHQKETHDHEGGSRCILKQLLYNSIVGCNQQMTESKGILKYKARIVFNP